MIGQGTTLLVSEIFETIQGEGYWSGSPAVFVRLQGCLVGCPWCDTKHTWSEGKASAPRDAVFTRSGADGGIEWDIGELHREIRSRYTARHVVITGGEPLAQSIAPFCELLLADGRLVQVETSGTYEARVPDDVFVTVSPKVGMPGGRKVLTGVLSRADEIKFPVGKASDIRTIEALLPDVTTGLIWLQPLSMSEKATRLCVSECIARNWRLSVQTHKFIGIA